MDFSTLVAAVDESVIVAGLTALAAVKMAPGVAKWGYNKVIGWFR
jgi:hypothetical protein